MRTIKAILILAITLLMNSNLLAQEVRVSNWQAIETSNSEPYGGASVYCFVITDSIVKSTNRRGTKDFGTHEIGKTYTEGSDSWVYTVGKMPKSNLLHGGKDIVIFQSKNSVTGKWTQIMYILKNSKKKKK
jgi:hypothetical protein